MEQQIRSLWPNAPIAEHAASGRWVRFLADRSTILYIQRYAWDEDTRPDFIVVCHDEADDGPVALRRYADLAEAVSAVRGLCAAPAEPPGWPAPRTGARCARINGPGRGARSRPSA